MRYGGRRSSDRKSLLNMTPMFPPPLPPVLPQTSLLAALGKRLAKQPQAILSGAVNYYPGPSGSPATANDIPMAYVAQETAFFSNLTVWETVLLSARLRCDASDDSVAEQAHALIKRLGLAECMHTRVGGDTGGRMVPGISGGEKRRLSIACELAGSNMDQATILIADEPTSGLDAFQADLVVAKLKELASLTGSIVMCSLHQPRSASMHRVDDLLLMVPGGRVAYHGPMSSCLEHFRRLGHVCPAHHSPAEFLVDLVSVDNSSEDTRQASEQRILRIVSSWRDRSDGVKSEEPQVGPLTELFG